ILRGVATHHDTDGASLYGVLCATADNLSAGRPGARTEPSDVFVRRMQKLEEICTAFPGVKKCYAIQAGREVRAFVDPATMQDGEAMVLARDISRRIEAELQYPGQIRVVVIRETRCVEYAR
ncbi:MAG: ribonuclease Y, partial [Kiritimatiellaeota bacterium]|nr:ribonuclease Y [Kiritimatiellota bacterium]